MLTELEAQSNVLSLEAMHNELGLESALSQLPQFISKIRGFFADRLGNPLQFNFLGDRRTKFLKSVEKTTYLDFKNVTLYVPQGLTCQYLEHAKVLDDAVSTCLTMEADVLDPLIKWLGERIGNPSSLASVTSALKIDGFSGKDFEKQEKNYHACFVAHGKKESEVPYQKAIARQNDWAKVLAGLESMELRMSIDLHNRLIEKMKRLDDLLETLVRRMKESPNAYRLSPRATSDLAQTVFSAARRLEFYALTKFRLEEYSVAVKDSIEKLSKFV